MSHRCYNSRIQTRRKSSFVFGVTYSRCPATVLVSGLRWANNVLLHLHTSVIGVGGLITFSCTYTQVIGVGWGGLIPFSFTDTYMSLR